MTKTSALDLAIFGNDPLFAEPLHVGRPNIGDREALLGRINDILDRRWLTNNGRYVQEFEARIAEMSGTRHAIAMCNATVGLEIAIKALGLTGEVIVPSFTFVATAHALQFQGVTPVFCDIDPRTHNIDPSAIEALITPRTTGILPVHTWGRPCDVAAIDEIARRHGLRVLYDAAHAFACSADGRPIGSFGDAEVFSFHATKFLNAFEGGAIVTNDDELAARIRLMKNFGFQGYDNVVDVGVNGKMSEVSAAMGLTGLESIDEFIETNERNHETYRLELADIPGVMLTQYDPAERSNHQYVVIEIDEDEAGISRDRMVEILWAENVMARRYFYPGCHMMEPYRTLFPDAGAHLPETERLVERVISLPTGTAVGADQIAGIASIIRLACNDAALCAPGADAGTVANN
jgi:dTDP-4-amino-4,6-dideoxygalactose transaminase